MGGGIILSPYFHESEKIPVQNIPAVVSCIMFFVSSFALLGQISRKGISFGDNSHWWFCFTLLFVPSVVGMGLGYLVNIRQKNIRWRRFCLRFTVAFMFFKLTVELVRAVFEH